MKLNFDKDGKTRLKCLIGSRNGFEFLGYSVDLDSGDIQDSLKQGSEVIDEFYVLQVLLSHYSKAEPVTESGNLIKFANLEGGQAYETAFLNRAVKPLVDVFGDKPEELEKCAKRFDGHNLPYGDCSFVIPALPHIPLTIILWEKSEFPAEANILYDTTANKYLPTEDLAVLGELMTTRLIQALQL